MNVLKHSNRGEYICFVDLNSLVLLGRVSVFSSMLDDNVNVVVTLLAFGRGWAPLAHQISPLVVNTAEKKYGSLTFPWMVC